MRELKDDYFISDDVVGLSRDLLGKVIITRIRGNETAGIITETEAYAGESDRASHAFNGRRTARTEVMYGSPATAYIYLCYGIHHLFNIVTNREEIPHAILIRGIRPLTGIGLMEERRGRAASTKGFTSGPGTVSQALGLTTALNGVRLGKEIRVTDQQIIVPKQEIRIGPRIGVDYAGDDAKLPYRFVWDY